MWAAIWNPSAIFGGRHANHAAVFAGAQFGCLAAKCSRRPDHDFPGWTPSCSASIVRDDTGQDRQARHVVPAGGTAVAEVTSPQGHFASAVATLVSDVSDPRHMSGEGSGSALATVPPNNQIGLSSAQSLSQFNLFFFLDSPHRFDFTAEFTGTGRVSDPQHFSARSWTAALVAISAAETFNVFEHARPIAIGAARVRETGLLQPSEYQILIEQIVGQDIHQPGSTIGAAQGQFAFTFDLTPSTVPEPASLVLLGSGLVGLLGLRHRRN